MPRLLFWKKIETSFQGMTFLLGEEAYARKSVYHVPEQVFMMSPSPYPS